MRTQRYRVVVEVDLEDRGDYSNLRRFVEAAFAPLKAAPLMYGDDPARGRVRVDYLSIEKAPK